MATLKVEKKGFRYEDNFIGRKLKNVEIESIDCEGEIIAYMIKFDLENKYTSITIEKEQMIRLREKINKLNF